jgi:hypothetical protein
MRSMFRWALIIAVIFSCYVLDPSATHADALKFSSSTQFLWGDDLLGDSQNVLAQYLRLTYAPEGQTLSVTGYGRLIYDFNGSQFYDDSPGFIGKLYYLYLDYKPVSDISLRLGRQYVAFTSGKSLMDGLRVDLHNLGPFGITIAGGMNVVPTLDSTFSTLDGNYFWGVDLHLEKTRTIQLGISFAEKFDEWDRARESIGANFRYMHKYFSPYAEVRYDWFTRSFDEATMGVDIYPINNLLIKAEYYHAYPTFDSTSIYSVFAVDNYTEYLLHAEYSFEAPVAVYAAYARQSYDEGENADRFTFGAKVFPLKGLTLNASVDYRHGYGGSLWGFEITADYKLLQKFIISAGIQYDEYQRPDQFGNQFARRYWIGGDWLIAKNLSAIARIEDNVNESFAHRTLGRVALNWNL